LNKKLAEAATSKEFKESHDDLELKIAQMEMEMMNFE